VNPRQPGGQHALPSHRIHDAHGCVQDGEQTREQTGHRGELDGLLEEGGVPVGEGGEGRWAVQEGFETAGGVEVKSGGQTVKHKDEEHPHTQQRPAHRQRHVALGVTGLFTQRRGGLKTDEGEQPEDDTQTEAGQARRRRRGVEVTEAVAAPGPHDADDGQQREDEHLQSQQDQVEPDGGADTAHGQRHRDGDNDESQDQERDVQSEGRLEVGVQESAVGSE
jgi:hypothetical protein